uniref:Zinc import ATP-binding protein ZnuC n=1 Tax=Anthurium amnicola TaxID=1678845 RepID=A0A1D1YYK9_9ARAE
MEVPTRELPTLIKRLVTTDSEEQLEEFFTSEVEFRHPLVIIQGSRDSRHKLFSLYKYCQVLTGPHQVEVHEVMFDPHKKVGFIHYTTKLHPLLFPYLTVAVRTMSHADFRVNKDGRWVISKMEDFISIEDLLNLVVPYSQPFVNYFKAIGGLAGISAGKVLEKIGWFEKEVDRETYDLIVER